MGGRERCPNPDALLQFHMEGVPVSEEDEEFWIWGGEHWQPSTSVWQERFETMRGIATGHRFGVPPTMPIS